MRLGNFSNSLQQIYAIQEAVQRLYRQVKMSGTIFVMIGSFPSGLRGHWKAQKPFNFLTPPHSAVGIVESPVLIGLKHLRISQKPTRTSHNGLKCPKMTCNSLELSENISEHLRMSQNISDYIRTFQIFSEPMRKS